MEVLRREFIYLWYYFTVQLEQIFLYWHLFEDTYEKSKYDATKEHDGIIIDRVAELAEKKGLTKIVSNESNIQYPPGEEPFQRLIVLYPCIYWRRIQLF